MHANENKTRQIPVATKAREKTVHVKIKKTGKRSRHLRVPVLPEEEAEIKQLAANSGRSVAAYLRNIGLGYRVEGILDNRRIEELMRINGDLGRLGGLLKLWLTNDERTRTFGESTIRTVLAKIEHTQNEMYEVVKTVLVPRADR